MKRTPPSTAAFLTPRTVASLIFGSIGLLLMVLGLIAFPSSTTKALPGTCHVVMFTAVNEKYEDMYVKMSTNPDDEDYCKNGCQDLCTIFYTVANYTFPSNTPAPGPTPSYPPTLQYLGGEGVPVPLHEKRFFYARAYKHNAVPDENSASTSFEADNTQQ